jgi:hypothetical protein
MQLYSVMVNTFQEPCQFWLFQPGAGQLSEESIDQVPARDVCTNKGRLALYYGTWHGGIMTEPKPKPRALGVLLAIGAIGGVIYGSITGQPSAGLLIGFGGGAAIAMLFWIIDRTRTG